MKNLNQRKINRIFIGVLVVLVCIMAYSKATEPKRVVYYVCYDRLISDNYSLTVAEVKERCRNEVD